MQIKIGASAANRRIEGRAYADALCIGAQNLNGQAAVKRVNNAAPGGNWTNTIVGTADGRCYVELTAAELAVLAEGDIVSWTCAAVTGQLFVPPVQIVSNYASDAVTSIGTPVALDGGAATLSGMLTKMADDNGGADFNATTDSLNKIQTKVSEATPHQYYPATATRTIGSDQGGSAASLAAHDEVYMVTGENNSTGMQVDISILTPVAEYMQKITVPGYYNGGSTHSVACKVYNHLLAAYETKFTMLSRTTAFDYEAGLTSDHHNPVTGEVLVRFEHSAGTYVPSHRLYLDMVQITKSESLSTIAADVATIAASTAAIQVDLGDPSADATTIYAQQLLIKGYVDTLESIFEGQGSETVTLQFYITATTTPIPGAKVTVMNGDDSLFLSLKTLDDNGRASMARDPGTYKLRVVCAGYTFSNPLTLTVTTTGTYTFYGDGDTIPSPGSADTCTVAIDCFEQDGVTPMASVVGKATITSLPFESNGRFYTGQQKDGTYNASTGRLTFVLPRGAKVAFDIRHIDGGKTQKRTIPNASSVKFEDIAS